MGELGWQIAHGPDIAPDTVASERDDYGQVVLERRLSDALGELNPTLPTSAIDDAYRKLIRPEGATLEARNQAFHRMLVNGVEVEYPDGDGRVRGGHVRVIDFTDHANNDWVAVNQFTITENKNTRRPDIVLFLNGLPLGIMELKNAADEDATVWSAFDQLQTYKAELPTLFSFNDALVVSDGVTARIGALTSGREWFKPWRTVTGEELAASTLTELQGIFDPRRFLAMIRHFIVFEDDGGGKIVKKVAGYHQYHAVRVAVSETLRAGISSGHLSNIISGKANPSPGVLKRLRAVLFQRSKSEERVMPAEVKVLGWRKGERSGMVVHAIRYDDTGRAYVTHMIKQGCSALLTRQEPAAV